MNPDQWRTVARVLTIVCTIGMIAYGILSFIFGVFGGEVNPIHYVLYCYYILFGLLLGLSEFDIKGFRKHFGFINNQFGKGIFVIFVAALTYSSGKTWMIVVAIVLAVLGVILIFLSCCSGDWKKVKEGSQEGKREFITEDQEKDTSMIYKYATQDRGK